MTSISSFLQSCLILFSLSLWTTCCEAARDDFNEFQFRRSVDQAMKSVKTILDTTRNPRLAEDEDHTYDDKFALAEFLTNTVVAAEMNALERLGLTQDVFSQAWKWVHDDQRSVTLRFQASDSCTFVEERDVSVVTRETEIEEENMEITERGEARRISGDHHGAKKSKTVKTKIKEIMKEYQWEAELSMHLTLFFGNEPAHGMELLSRNSSKVIVTSRGANSKAKSSRPPPPIPAKTDHKPIDVNLTWLFQMISKEKIAQFSIDLFSDEAAKTCKTPRRNNDINEAVNFLHQFSHWAKQTTSFFSDQVERRILHKHNPVEPPPSNSNQRMYDEIRKLAESLFHPTLPLLEKSALLSELDLGALLQEQNRRLDGATEQLKNLYPSHDDQGSMLSTSEATIVMISCHVQELSSQYIDSIKYIEHTLESQLIRAIGKQVTAEDFGDFMRTYQQKLFGPSYAPKLFSYAVRRPEHYPDGMVSIEATGSKGKSEPVETWVRQMSSNAMNNRSVFVPLNAATSVELKGGQFLHGWMQHRFEGGYERKPRFTLSARAHQFSSFLLIIGTMAGPNKFKPTGAIILQNKDEVLIPLITEVLPSAKEFKDAIASLSQEQQEFAKAFRAMQLETSVFGVAIIQLKPQLEKLLGLPSASLTKEIQLTQDLMTLFIDYQIPSDLLSVSDLSSNRNATEKLDSVKSSVLDVMNVIDRAKEEQLKEEKRKADMRESTYESLSMMKSAASPSAAPSSYPSASSSQSYTASAARSSQRSFSGEYRVRRRAASSPSSEAGQAKEEYRDTDDASLPKSNDKTHVGSIGDDVTLIPAILDAEIEKYDSDGGSLRSTIVKAESHWQRSRQENLLAPSSDRTELQPALIEAEQKKAFDLLDALSRSGSLAIDRSELHIVVAVSHCFEQDIMTTLIEENINPIEKVEKSALLVASTIHGKAIEELVGSDATLKRLTKSFPSLFDTLNAEISA